MNKDTPKQKATDIVLAKPPAPADDALDGVLEKQISDNGTSSPKREAEVTRKIAKEGIISFQTKSIPATRNAIYRSVQKLAGYIAEENESNDSSGGRKDYVLKARIPEQSFDQFVNDVSSNAIKIDSKDISVKDVTSDYIDVTTDLANKQQLQQRYVELLKKGSKMADLLEIENKITEIETDIESTMSQINYLTKQVEYSELDITFYVVPPASSNPPTFAFKLISALSGGWDVLTAVFFGVVTIWPIWSMAIILYFAIGIWRKRHPQNKGLQL